MSSVVIAGNTSGTITLDAPNVAGTTVLTLPTANGTVLTTANTFAAGTGPAFRASASALQSLTNQTNTKITLDVELFDTNNNFASSRFTPTVAGYYLIAGQVSTNTTLNNVPLYVQIFKNGSSIGSNVGVGTTSSSTGCHITSLVYMNGSTDYVELYAQPNAGTINTLITTFATYDSLYFQGFLVRAA